MNFNSSNDNVSLRGVAVKRIRSRIKKMLPILGIVANCLLFISFHNYVSNPEAAGIFRVKDAWGFAEMRSWVGDLLFIWIVFIILHVSYVTFRYLWNYIVSREIHFLKLQYGYPSDQKQKGLPHDANDISNLIKLDSDGEFQFENLPSEEQYDALHDVSIEIKHGKSIISGKAR